jgi:hypothetical protein
MKRFFEADAFGCRSPSLEGPQYGLPCVRDRVLMSTSMASAGDAATPERSRFKFVCEDCGSLSIKVTDPANSPAAALVHCGRCNAVRGTLGALHDLARRGADLFEF